MHVSMNNPTPIYGNEPWVHPGLVEAVTAAKQRNASQITVKISVADLAERGRQELFVVVGGETPSHSTILTEGLIALRLGYNESVFRKDAKGGETGNFKIQDGEYKVFSEESTSLDFRGIPDASKNAVRAAVEGVLRELFAAEQS